MIPLSALIFCGGIIFICWCSAIFVMYIGIREAIKESEVLLGIISAMGAFALIWIGVCMLCVMMGN